MKTNFKEHTKVAQSIIIPIALLIYILQLPKLAYWYVLGFEISVFLLSPDIDKNRTQVDNNWGIWQILFNPLSARNPHRQKLHDFLWGTFLKNAYVIIPLHILYLIPAKFNLIFVWDQYVIFWKTHYSQYALFFVGMSTADTIHIIHDYFGSFITKEVNQFRKFIARKEPEEKKSFQYDHF